MTGRQSRAGRVQPDRAWTARVIPRRRFNSPAENIRYDDEVLMPGLVDTHVHVNEPGRTDWEGFATATAAAAAGGVTTIIDMPLNSIPPTIDVAALEAKRAAADGQCAVDVGFWGGAVPANAADRAALHDAGVFGFKCFMIDSGVPEFPPLDDHALAAAMKQVADLGSLLIVHAEDAASIAAARFRRAATTKGSCGPGRRPPRSPRSSGCCGWPPRPVRACTCCTCPAPTLSRC